MPRQLLGVGRPYPGSDNGTNGGLIVAVVGDGADSIGQAGPPPGLKRGRGGARLWGGGGGGPPQPGGAAPPPAGARRRGGQRRRRGVRQKMPRPVGKEEVGPADVRAPEVKHVALVADAAG